MQVSGTPSTRGFNIFGIRFSMTDFVIFACFLFCIMFVYGALTWTDELNEFGGDSATYLLISRVYSPYHAASAAAIAFKSQIISPPLFPFMLALIDGGYHFLLAHLLVGVFGCASAVTLYLWLRKESVSPLQSAVIAAIWAFAPANLLHVFNIWTEYPYLFCSLAVIVLVSNAEQTNMQKKWFLAAIFVACACLIRAAALPLMAAFVVYLIMKRPKNTVYLAMVAVLPFVVWALYSGHSEQGGGSYVKQFADMYGADPLGKLVQQVTVEFLSVKAAWQAGWLGGSYSPLLKEMVWVFWWLCIAGWMYRLIKRKFDAIYLGLYFLQLLLWAHPEEASRYALVTYPVLVASGFLLLYQIATALRDASTAKYIPFAAIAISGIAMIPNWIFVAQRFADGASVGLDNARYSNYWYAGNQSIALRNARFQAELIQHLKELPKLVPADACIFAIKPTIVSLYADRSSFGPPKLNVADSQFDAEIRKCHYAYVFPFASPSYGAEFYPLGRLGNRAKLVSNFLDDAGQMDGGLIEITP